jgi:hypothetical protein
LGSTPPAQGQQPAQAPQTRYDQSVQREPTTMTVPTAAMKRIKDEARESGRSEALNALAQQAGYGDAEELSAALAQLRAGGPSGQQVQPRQVQQPAQQPQYAQEPTDNGDPALDVKNARRELSRYERQMEKLTRERDQFQRQYNETLSQTTQLQESLDAKDAEMSLRETAVGSGVKDVDYALRLLTRELENKSEEELVAFDEGAFFSSLRASKPYLFGETIRPANTGPGTASAPAAPRAAAVNQQTAANSQLDAKKMNPQEFQELLRKRGLNANQ